MLARPTKKELSAEDREKITQGSARQTGSMVSPKTYDPAYPVHEVPVNAKQLIYIPNHTVQTEDGANILRADRFAAHQVRQGKAYGDVRCIGEIVNPSLGWDGSCPLCNGRSECWDLYNHRFKDLAKSRGLDPDAEGTKEALRDTSRTMIQEMAIGQADLWITFPIVVIKCKEGTIEPELTPEGGLIGTPMFYSIRQRGYDEKWDKAFDALEDEGEDVGDRNPGGRWAVLNYTYTPKTGQHNKRDSAQNLKVYFVKRENLKGWCGYFDKLTVDWTPEKAQDVLVRNAVRSMDEQVAVSDSLLESTRKNNRMYELGGSNGGTAVAPPNGADAALQQFGAEPVTEGAVSAPTASAGAPPMGEMPKNVGVE